MKQVLRLIITSLSVSIIASACESKLKKQFGTDSVSFSTQSQDLVRLKKLGLDKPSENASYLLDTNKITIPKGDQGKTDTAAINRAKPIEEFNVEAIIVLKSDTALKGVLVWDVLQSTGLIWGDGDLFHWANPRRDYGDGALFSVWTTTAPGYFLPESIKAGRMNPQNLVFGFSIPRNADPEHVFDVMIGVVKYCQKRLGGQILNQKGQPFNEDTEKKELALLVDKMKSQGVVPGSGKALRVY